MGSNFEFTPDEEDSLLSGIEAAAARAASYGPMLTPQLASAMGRIGDRYPLADAGVSLSVAQAVSTGLITPEQADRVVESSLEVQIADNINDIQENRPWWKRGRDWMYDRFKSGVKWAAAGAEFVPQLVTNAGARIYSAPGLDRGIEDAGFYQHPTSGFFNGWFSSTDLGGLLSGKDSGTGFFIGEAAREYQQQQVLAYRGGFKTADGTVLPFTYGRTAAGIFFRPDDSGYQWVSGLTDMALALAIPSIPGAKAIARTGRGATASLAAAAGVDEASALRNTTVTLRRYAGITRGADGVIDIEKFQSYLGSNEGAELVKFIANDISTFQRALFEFSGDLPATTLRQLSRETDPEKIKQILIDNVGLVGVGGKKGITTIAELPKPSLRQRWDFLKPWKENAVVGDESFELATEAKKIQRSGKEPRVVGRELRRLRAKALRDKSVQLVFDDEIATTESLRNLTAYMDMLRVPQAKQDEVLNQILDFAVDPVGGNIRDVVGSLKTMTADAVVNTKQIRMGGWSEQSNREAINILYDHYNRNADSLYSAADMNPLPLELMDADDIVTGMDMTGVPASKFLAVNAADGTSKMVDAPNNTAMLMTEEMRRVITLPNARELRRATSRLAFLFERGSLLRESTPLGKGLNEMARTGKPGNFGQLNAPLAFLDTVVNKIWRQSTLFTGGYVLRNLMDSMLRAAIAPGLRVGVMHPVEHLALVRSKKNVTDLLGNAWDERRAEQVLHRATTEMRDAIGNNARDINPVHMAKRARKLEAYGRQQLSDVALNSGDFDRYVQGLADQLHLLSRDPLVQLLAHNVQYTDNGIGQLSKLEWFGAEGARLMPDSIRNWLKFHEQGQEYARSVNRRWRGVRFGDGTDLTKYDIAFLDESGELIDQNWEALINVINQRIQIETLGRHRSLMPIITGDDIGTPMIGRRTPDGDLMMRPAFKQVADDIKTDVDYFGYTDDFVEEVRAIVTEAIESGDTSMLPGSVKYRISVEDARKRLDGRVMEAFDNILSRFFGEVYGSKEAKWNRSPVAREFYWEQASAMIDAMRPEDARQLITNIRYGLGGSKRELLKALRNAPKEPKVFTKVELDTLIDDTVEEIDRLRSLQAAGETVDELGRDLGAALAENQTVLSKLQNADRQAPKVGLKRGAVYRVEGLSGRRRIPADGKWQSMYKRSGVWVSEEEWTKVVARAEADVRLFEKADKLLPEDFAAMLDDIKDVKNAERVYGTATVKEMADAVGGEDRLAAIIRRANLADDAPTADPRGVFYTFEQVDDAAKLYSAEATKKLFYDASDRSNAADIMQILSPFATSWYEVTRKYAQETFRDANRFKNVTMTTSNLRPQEENGQNNGFLWTHPVTKELMFNVPLDSYVMPALAAFGGSLVAQSVFPNKPGITAGVAGAAAFLTRRGLTPGDVDVQATAPVRSLTMGLTIMPGFGPVVQWPAKQILKDKPGQQDLLQFIAPYGAEEFTLSGALTQFTPAWVRKAEAALIGNERSDVLYLQMHQDVLSALAASGKYDLSTGEGRAALDNRSRQIARSLMLTQALGQFAGPYRPNFEFNVPVEFNDLMAPDDVKQMFESSIPSSVYLSSVYRGLQDEDFQSAPRRMMEIFGEDILMYLGSRTESRTQGLGVGEEFTQFELRNSQFRDQNPLYWAYFVEAGTDFDYPTYRRQLDTGQRIRTVDYETLIADAQETVGKSLYRDWVRTFINDESDYAQTLKRQKREELYRLYPGYANAAMNTNELSAAVRQLREAALDESAPQNQIVVASRMYFTKRDEVLREADRRAQAEGGYLSPSDPLGAAAFRDLRYVMLKYGEELAVKYPAFERLWSRELIDEVSLAR